MKKLNKSKIIIFYLMTFFLVVYFNGDFRLSTLLLITFIFLIIYFLSNVKQKSPKSSEPISVTDFFRSLRTRF